MFRLFAQGAGVGLALVLISACAPSLRMLHRSNEVFEHCYATDFATEVEVPAKTACWTDWIDNFSEGQTPDRISYAERRRESLGQNEPAPTLTEPQTTENTPIVDASTVPFATPRSSSTCEGTCDPAYQRCRTRCDGRSLAPCRTACDAEYRTCREGCY